jgi:hypothetical protein
MPSEEFWEGEPRHLLSYIEAYRLRLEREEKFKSQFTDYQAWLIGAYCENAFSVALSNALVRKVELRQSIRRSLSALVRTEPRRRLMMNRNYWPYMQGSKVMPMLSITENLEADDSSYRLSFVL